MKQRLVFAAALLHRPEILIVDEPMVGLDPKSIRLVKDLLREKADSGTTVFMSTHTLAVAEEIGDRIGIIDRGKIKFVGTIEELKKSQAQQQSTLERMFLELTESGEDSAPATSSERERHTRPEKH
jgi:ABC-2 type transport system ATP-binding protein